MMGWLFSVVDVIRHRQLLSELRWVSSLTK
jgi:hypothetical protein